MSDNITTDEMALALFRLEIADRDQEIAVQTLFKEFTLFKDLPAELRRIIFRLMFPGPRRFVMFEDIGEGVADDEVWLRLACPPVTAHINHESRQETLSVYRGVEVVANSRGLRRGLWNPQKDIFKCAAYPVVHCWVPSYFRSSWKSFAKSIKFLELDMNILDEDYHFPSNERDNTTWALLWDMKNLSGLVLQGKGKHAALLKMDEWRLEMQKFCKTIRSKAARKKIPDPDVTIYEH